MAAEGKDIKDIFHGLKYLMDNILTSWDAWVPTVVAQTPGVGAVYTVNQASYKTFGKTVNFKFDVSITNAGTDAGLLTFTLPVATSSTNRFCAAAIDRTGTVNCISGNLNSATIQYIRVVGGTTIVTGRVYNVCGTYEIP